MKSLLGILAALLLPLAALHAAPKLNILLFTADDMNFDSSGVCGEPVKNLTPHIDALAAQGLRFEHACTIVAVCQPSRQTMLTGLYPHRSGSMGFFPLKADARTLNDQLHWRGGEGRPGAPAHQTAGPPQPGSLPQCVDSEALARRKADDETGLKRA